MANEVINVETKVQNIDTRVQTKAQAKAASVIAYLSLDELTAALVRKAVGQEEKQVTTMRSRVGSGQAAFCIDDIIEKKPEIVDSELFDIVASCKGFESYICVTNGEIDKWLLDKNPENGYPLNNQQIVEITASYKDSQAAFNHTNLSLRKANPELWKEKQAEAKKTLEALGL